MADAANENAKLYEVLREARSALIVGHNNPDGDLISSALALKIGLEQKGKEAAVYLDCFPVNKFGFLPKTEEINVSGDNVKENYDLVVGLDYGSSHKLHLPPNFREDVFFATIDHHLKDSQIGECQVIEDDKSSTCEIVYRILQEMGVDINRDIANCLACGIITDTGGLQHQRVGTDTFLIVSDLVQRGARLNKVVKHLFRNHSVSVLKLWGRILSRIKKDPKNLMSFSVVSRKDLAECGCEVDDVAGLVSIINTNPDTKFTLLLTETDEKLLNGSLRSEGYTGIDVSKIAKVFGGGGHRLASGFKSSEDLQEILRKIYDSLEC